jgi:hypothetical protein
VSQKLIHVTRTAGEPTAPLTSAPPQVDEQTRAQIADAAAKDPQGQHQGGDAAPKVKTEKECMLQPGRQLAPFVRIGCHTMGIR